MIESPNSQKNSLQENNTQPKQNPTDEKNVIERFKIVGYFPNWQPESEKEIQYNKLTHINYCFAIPTRKSTLRPLDNPELARKVIANGHKNNVKVLIAIGGWGYKCTTLEPTFLKATCTDEKCKTLSDNILALVDEYGFDGVDVDWEHPRTKGNSGKQYEKLISCLRSALNQRKKLLTSAVIAGINADGSIIYDAAAHSDNVLNDVNWLNIMAYDGGDGKEHSTFEFAINSANYWLKTRNLSNQKVVLGVPFYARPSWAAYADILTADENAHTKDISNYKKAEAYYNGLETIKAKTR